MKRRLTAILVLIAAMGLLLTACSPGFSAGGSAQAPQLGKLAPAFQLPNLDGTVVSLSDLRGKPVLVNFWATGCPACREEMPYIQAVFEGWSDKELVILAIDIGERLATVEDFVQSYKLAFTVLLDSHQDVAQKYNIRYPPTTFLIDRDGIIQVVKVGAFSSVAEIEENLSKIMP